jgi:AcrR family transcriptional regulator
MSQALSQRPRRQDAQRNRQRLLAAARVELSRGGIDVPMSDIARRAGVGIGTLYRHFPSRRHVLVELWLARQAALAEAARAGLGNPDPWSGFCEMMREGAAIQVRETAFADMTRRRVGDHPDVVRARAEVMALIAAQVDRAQKAGVLRADIVAEDIPIMLFAIGDSGKGFWTVAPRLFERYLTIVLDGLRTPQPSELAHPPLAREQFEAAIRSGDDFRWVDEVDRPDTLL